MFDDLIHVEILLKPESFAEREEIIKAVQRHQGHENGYTEAIKFSDSFLKENVQSITVLSNEQQQNIQDDVNSEYRYHVYKLYDLEAGDEILENRDDPDLPAASHLILPSVSLKGLWENLVFDSEIKKNLLRYIETIINYSDRKVDPNVISCNRVVFLYGPPGTGKTSLCRALAQKVAIRLSHRYKQGSLLEINSHSLFSKWFSESGNLVRKMFAKIEELVSDPDNFVCVLIDEVESLTCARASHDSGTEPSDAIRVVNALLTQIDRIKTYSNVVVLTTSNVQDKIDAAFVDRADVKQFIGPPSKYAIYEILRSCILELMRVDIITPKIMLLPYHGNVLSGYGDRLNEISDRCLGLSGRALRKLPFITEACFLKSKTYSVDVFLDGLSKAVDQRFDELKKLSD